MALNPPLSQEGMPLRVEGEYLILERNNIEVEFKIPVFGTKTGKGKLYLTTARMVFVDNSFLTNSFKSFDIPLAFMYNESFEQPIFGSNYLKGETKPLYNLLNGDTKFKLWFMNGGCGTFLKSFCAVLDQIRQKRGPDPRFIDQVRIGKFGTNQAFVDPNDPSKLFFEQTGPTYNQAMQNQQFVGQNYQYVPQMQGGQQIGTNGVQQNQMQQGFQQPQQQMQPQSQYYGGGGVMIGGGQQNPNNYVNPNLPQQQYQNMQQPQQYQPDMMQQQNVQQPQYQDMMYQQNMQQQNPNMQQFNPNMQQQNPNMQQFNPNMQQQNPNMQQQNPNMQQQNPNMQQQNPNILPFSVEQPQQQPQQNMNVGYYFGFGLGPQLNRNH